MKSFKLFIMSKIGKQPIKILDDVKVEFDDKQSLLTFTGKKGTLTHKLNNVVELILDDEKKEIVLKPRKTGREFFAIWGTERALIANCIVGVSSGFEKKLIIEGIGYKAEVKGDKLVLNVGYSHPVNLDIPKDLTVTVEKTIISISGISKKLVGDFAALVRIQRKTNPYSLKGVKYSDERVIKKSGKKAG